MYFFSTLEHSVDLTITDGSAVAPVPVLCALDLQTTGNNLKPLVTVEALDRHVFIIANITVSGV